MVLSGHRWSIGVFAIVRRYLRLRPCRARRGVVHGGGEGLAPALSGEQRGRDPGDGPGTAGGLARGDAGQPEDIVACLAGTAAKDDAEDLARLRRYLDQRVSRRSGAAWRQLYAARHLLTPQ